VIIKNYLNKIADFALRRFTELIGIILVCLSILLFISLISYSPNDPNFIFPESQQIENLLGLKGSLIADMFYQSIGIISLLVPFSLFFTGISITINKRLVIVIENIFFVILYIIIATSFFSIFNIDSYWLIINGNEGFVGDFISKTFVADFLKINEKISYYFLILLTLLFFLLSSNFKISHIYKIFLFFKKIFLSKEKKIKSDESLEKNNLINTNSVETRHQEDLFNNYKKNNSINDFKIKLPLVDFLKKPEKLSNKKDEIKVDGESLEKILLDFGVEGKIKRISHGPVVSLNEFEPAAGVKVSKIINLSEDIARNTSSETARISTIPGSSTIGIELPKISRENVYLREIIDDKNFKNKNIKLPIALGKSISGEPITSDLSSMPHLLIAGTTGSGKSVCINTIILSLIYRHTPEICKFILIDPKMLELSTYEGIPHLLCPVITEAKKAASVLGWVVKEMESRYRLMTKVGVKNIDGYNEKNRIKMPYIVVIVDEMSDLMLVAGKEIENYIQKLSQMARAAGIHIIMATQRPSVDVITGTIKANFPTRISFQVTSKIDSRTILGEQGAEQLLGKGDMLFMSSANRITRIHAPYVSEIEIDKVNNFLRNQAEPDYINEILNFVDEKEINAKNNENNDIDELYNTALEIVKSERKASTSFLQRKLQIGYNRAARIIDQMEANGEVSKANHVGKREVLS
tara:strand:- start:1212 stop:3296 length:2085 start_codon:yes stop_codon:yes gene_type:complete